MCQEPFLDKSEKLLSLWSLYRQTSAILGDWVPDHCSKVNIKHARLMNF